MLDIQKLKKKQLELDKLIKEEFLERIRDEFLDLQLSEFYQGNILTKKRRDNSANPSPRVLHNWVKQGLLDAEEENEVKGWRKFNKIDSVWLQIVIKLREFGLSINSIKKVKDSLLDYSPSEKNDFSALGYAFLRSILDEEIILIVFPNGDFSMLPKHLYMKRIELGDLPSHIHINILILVAKEFPNHNFMLTEMKDHESLGQISESEMKLIYYLRTGDYDEMKIRMKDGEIYLLESKQKLSNRHKIIDIINEHAYQDIEIKVNGGKVVYISKNVKEQF